MKSVFMKIGRYYEVMDTVKCFNQEIKYLTRLGKKKIAEKIKNVW